MLLFLACTASGPSTDSDAEVTPAYSAAILEPSAPTENDTVTVVLSGWTGGDEQPLYEWSVDDVLVSTDAVLTGALFDKGQTLRAKVTPFDGLTQGTPLESNVVIAANTAPQVSVELTPAEFDTTTSVEAIVTIDDPDPADDPTLEFRWMVDDAPVGDDEAVLHSSFFIKGQVVTVDVSVDDGEASGDAQAEGTVQNAPPTEPGVLVKGQAGGLVCSVAVPSTDADDEPLSYDFLFLADGVATAHALDNGDETSTLSLSATDSEAGEVWTCEVTVDDGEATATGSSEGSAEVVGTQDNPGESCLDIYESGGTADGIYWIDPTGSNPYTVQCLMTLDGGGWTLVGTNGREGDVHGTGQFWDRTTVRNDVTHGTISDTDSYKSAAFAEVPFTDVRFDNGDNLDWAVYEDVYDGAGSWLDFDSTISENNCANPSFPMTSGSLQVGTASLCDTNLYVHPSDYDGQGCGGTGDNGGSGPTWSQNNNSSCPLDDSWYHSFTAGNQAGLNIQNIVWGENNPLRMWVR